MTRRLLIAGAGIAGLAAALAAGRARWQAHLFERASTFDEVGAGIQLGPNATRILGRWGLIESIRARGFAPRRLCVRDASSGRQLAVLPLGEDIERRYAAPYLTIHRADLHDILLQAVRTVHGSPRTGAPVASCLEEGRLVRVRIPAGLVEGEALVVADGLWSGLRQQLLQDGAPRVTGHLACRGLIAADLLRPAQRTAEVTAWLGPRLHAVSYPVRGGELMNLVCVVEGGIEGDLTRWDAAAPAPGAAIRATACADLRDLFEAVPAWGAWVLHDRPPLRSARQMALRQVALLGDAAHPMLPYLAQGAAMAIEDADALGSRLASVGDDGVDVPIALRRYALERWRRCARVQRRSQRNGVVFHATGPLRWARDAALRILGSSALDLPWLYRDRAAAAEGETGEVGRPT